VQERGEERPVDRREAYRLAVQLSLEDRELVAQRQDLRVFDTIGHR
jgi:hypothetical protein